MDHIYYTVLQTQRWAGISFLLGILLGWGWHLAWTKYHANKAGKE